MTVNDLICFLNKLQNEDKGDYQIQAHDIDYNTANGGNYYIQQNERISNTDINIDDNNKTITFGTYYEYYSY